MCPDPKDCKNCEKAGLAILPVRYTVVPPDITTKLPAIAAPRIKKVALKNYRYALRTLRQGYLYVFYEKRWPKDKLKEKTEIYGSVAQAYECYSVSADGLLWRQTSPRAAQAISEPVCKDVQHHVPASVIAIPAPEDAGTVWIAFSEHKWSVEMLYDYGTTPALRAKRMQKIDPAGWITSKKHEDGFEATSDNLRGIIEYDSADPKAILPNKNIRLSEANGTYDAKILNKMCSRYPVTKRDYMRKPTVEKMNAIGSRGLGKTPYPPMVIALWDAIGTVHELNDFRNDAAGYATLYAEEREMELTSLNAIRATEKVINDRAGVFQDGRLQDSINGIRSNINSMRVQAATLPPNERQARLAKLDQDEDAAIKARVAHYRQVAEQDGAADWQRYLTYFNSEQVKNFEKKHNDLLKDIAKIMEERVDDVLAWLQHDLLIDTLEDYHRQWNVGSDDGIMFKVVVTEAIAGINTTQKGKQLLETWVKTAATKSPSNLLVRALGLNHDDGTAAVAEALAKASRAPVPVAANTFEFLAGPLRKISDLYKKTNTFFNTQEKARTKPDSGLRAVRAFKSDMFFLTAGDALFKPWMQKGVDTMGEKIVAGIMFARAEAEPEKIIQLLYADAKYGPMERKNIAVHLLKYPSLRPLAADLKHEELKKKWVDLKKDVEKGPIAIKENRVALVLILFETINMSKMVHGATLGNASAAQIGQATCTWMAAVLDMVANGAKHLSESGDKAMSFQRLKLLGGAFSAVAGVIGVGMDGFDAYKNREEGRYLLAAAYGGRAIAQLGSTYFGAATAISYAAPWLAAEGSKLTSEALLAARTRFMLWGLRFNMVGLALTVVIFLLKEDKLRTFLERSSFGVRSKTKPYGTLELMMEGFQEAVTDAR